MKILHLHVKKKWFDQIKSGEKKEEYRLESRYWRERLITLKQPDLIMIHCGYPRKGDGSRTLLFRYAGYYHAHGFVHEEFGDQPVNVFVVPLREEA